MGPLHGLTCEAVPVASSGALACAASALRFLLLELELPIRRRCDQLVLEATWLNRHAHLEAKSGSFIYTGEHLYCAPLRAVPCGTLHRRLTLMHAPGRTASALKP